MDYSIKMGGVFIGWIEANTTGDALTKARGTWEFTADPAEEEEELLAETTWPAKLAEYEGASPER